MPPGSRERFSSELLLKSIRKKEFAPVYFLYGEESLIVDEIVDAIVGGAVEESMKGFNLDILQGNDVSAQNVIDIALSFPMMAERRVVVVKDVDRLSGKEALEAYCERPSPTTVLVLTAGEPDLRRRPYPALRKAAAGGECAALRDDEVDAWIESRSEHLKTRIAPDAVELLHASVGNSLRDLNSQLEKLSLAAGPDGITAEVVEATVGVSREYSIFELTKAVGSKNKPRAIEIAERMLDAGESPQMMIVMLTRHFSILWKLLGVQRSGSAGDQAKAAGISPFFLREYLAHLRTYTPGEVEAAFIALANADAELKSQPTDPRLVVDVMLCSIMDGGIAPQH